MVGDYYKRTLFRDMPEFRIIDIIFYVEVFYEIVGELYSPVRGYMRKNSVKK